jgi:hypothetical protein
LVSHCFALRIECSSMSWTHGCAVLKGLALLCFALYAWVSKVGDDNG